MRPFLNKADFEVPTAGSAKGCSKPEISTGHQQPIKQDMPYAPLNKKCRELGCPNPKTGRSTFCTQHGGGFSEKAKANLKLYGQRAWEKIRTAQLSRQPLCGRCQSEGKITAAQHVDHVFPHRRDPTKFRVNLFQSLCAACHTLKTQDESKGKYLHYTAHGVVEYTDDDYVRMVGMHYSAQ